VFKRANIQSTPIWIISLTPNLILFSHIRLGLLSGLFPSAFRPQYFMHLSPPHACNIPHHLIFHYLILIIFDEKQICETCRCVNIFILYYFFLLTKCSPDFCSRTSSDCPFLTVTAVQSKRSNYIYIYRSLPV
jgi:hypothetical protein